jgi:deoxyribodipyrimidine photo-lyase
MNKPLITLVLLTTDLRLHDHPSFYAASLKKLPILAFYHLPQEERMDNAYGFKKMSDHRLEFLLETLLDLETTLKKVNIPLFCSFFQLSESLHSIQEQFTIDSVHYAYSPGDEEIAFINTLTTLLPNTPFHAYHQKTLLHPKDLPFPINNLPGRFTDFRIIVEKQLKIRPLIDTISVQTELLISTPSIKAFLIRSLLKTNKTMTGGETLALQHLDHYFFKSKKVLTYKFTRNGMLHHDDSTRFSPFLALGSLSPRMIYWQLKKVESTIEKNISTYWVLFELLWRDYFAFLHIQYGKAFFLEKGLKNRSFKWNHNPQYLTAWIQGQTGYPLVDANMKELATTGWMSNRGRQNVASFFTHQLKLDWRLGAQYFESMLIDYDVSSNYGNWQYISGVGVDPREDRVFNVTLQAKKYDPKGQYLKTWLPILKNIPVPEVFQPWKLNTLAMSIHQCDIGKDYPSPIIIDPRVMLND